MIDQKLYHPNYVFHYSSMPNDQRVSLSRKVHNKSIALKYVIDGSERYETNEGSFSVKNKDLLVLQADTPFDCIFDGSNPTTKGICIDINKKFFTKTDQEVIGALLMNQSLSISPTLLDQQLIKMENIEDAMLDQNIKYIIYFFKQYIAIVHNTYKHIDTSFKKRDTAIRNTHLIWEAKAQIQENTKQGFSLDRIAQLTGMSKFQLARLFKSSFGLTPLEYHHTIRINKAKQEIGRNHDFTTIAYSLGYESLATFSKKFKQITLMTPSQYKKAISNK
ncbi:MAG: AraC family transcriptional regulator [Bacteroidota bacterium]